MTTKPIDIPKQLVWDAWFQVKRNGGSFGIDSVSIEEFESKLKPNLYKIWNRMSSGSYFPPAVREVDIPKKGGGSRRLGIPSVSDRIAQTVVKKILEPVLDPVFHNDSYGYRPEKSAIDGVAITRRRCWKYPWLVEFDIKAMFDDINHELMLKALKKHCQKKWILMYVERWLKVGLGRNGDYKTRGTPQGGVISPLLANLFMHYTFDLWMQRKFPKSPFASYADDAVAHCMTKVEATSLLDSISSRLNEVGLKMHPEKSGIVFCKKNRRISSHTKTSFSFLGFRFRPRLARARNGSLFCTFSPAASPNSLKAMRQRIRRFKIHFRVGLTIQDLAESINPILRGWFNYYGQFGRAVLHSVWRTIDYHLVKWIMRKWRKFRRRKGAAYRLLQEFSKRNTRLFVHWQFSNQLG